MSTPKSIKKSAAHPLQLDPSPSVFTINAIEEDLYEDLPEFHSPSLEPSLTGVNIMDLEEYVDMNVDDVLLQDLYEETRMYKGT